MTKKLLLLGSSLLLFILLTLVFARGIVPLNIITKPANTPIIFGSSTALKGSASLLGQNMTLGERVYMDKVNAKGGVGGHKVALVVYDDAYDPLETAINMRKLIAEKKVLGVIGNVGTPTAVITLHIVNELQILFYGAFTGAKILRKNPPDRNVFTFRASYEDEIFAMIHGLLKVGIHPNEIAFFTQNDAFGESGYLAAIKILKEMGYANAEKLLHTRYTRNTLNVEEGLSEILDLPTAPKAIILMAPYMAAAKIIKLTLKELPDTIFLDVGFVGSTALASELKGVGDRQVVVTQVVPDFRSNLPGVVEYRETLKKFAPKATPGFISLEGYLATKMLMMGVERALKDNKLSREGLIEAMETLHKVDLGIGIIVGFGKDDHQALHTVWPTLLKDGQLVPFDWKELHVPKMKQEKD